MEQEQEKAWDKRRALRVMAATRAWIAQRRAESVGDGGEKEASDAALRRGWPVQIAAIGEEECGVGAENLRIDYEFVPTPWGGALVAATERGVCRLAFTDDREAAVGDLQRLFPRAELRQRSAYWSDAARMAMQSAGDRAARERSEVLPIMLHLRGTAFQMRVWRALTEIPAGGLLAYGDVAAMAGCGAAHRAVGTAVGRNPVALFVPCHRIVQASGALGGYHWGVAYKKALLDSEKY